METTLFDSLIIIYWYISDN